jgi:CubicO group peptidase (beta-lactamase class C family)
MILGAPMKFGMGFGLPGSAVPMPNPNTIFWGGYGGSLVLIDLDAHTTIAYAMNKMGATTLGDTRAFGVAMPILAEAELAR